MMPVESLTPPPPPKGRFCRQGEVVLASFERGPTGEVEQSKKPFKKMSFDTREQGFTLAEKQEAFYDRHVAPEFNLLPPNQAYYKRVQMFTEWQEAREANPLAGGLALPTPSTFCSMKLKPLHSQKPCVTFKELAPLLLCFVFYQFLDHYGFEGMTSLGCKYWLDLCR